MLNIVDRASIVVVEDQVGGKANGCGLVQKQPSTTVPGQFRLHLPAMYYGVFLGRSRG